MQTGEQLCDASAHWMQGGLGFVLLHDHLRGYTIPYQRAIVKLNLVFLTRDLVQPYRSSLKDGMLPFGFRQHSLAFNPGARLGQFSIIIISLETAGLP